MAALPARLRASPSVAAPRLALLVLAAAAAMAATAVGGVHGSHAAAKAGTQQPAGVAAIPASPLVVELTQFDMPARIRDGRMWFVEVSIAGSTTGGAGGA